MQYTLRNLNRFFHVSIAIFCVGLTASFSQTVDVTITQNGGQNDPTNVSPIVFQAAFSEAVTGFGAEVGDVTLSGTAGATTAVVAGGPITYTVTVSGMTGPGTVIIVIPANAATATAAPPARQNVASTNTDNSVTYDATAPTITASSIINNTNGTQFTLRVNADENSNVHYVVTTSATVPSIAQVLAGQNHLGAPALFSGNAAATATVNLDQVISGLTTSTLYHIYSVAQDALGNNSTVDAQSATATDTTAPTITSSSIISITSTQFTLRTNIDENSTVFYVVTTSATVPSIAQVLAGQDHLGAAAFKSGSAAATATVDLDQPITGLVVSTTYYIYSVARDASTNSSGVDSESATTICTPDNISALKISDANTTANLYWTDPTCFDEVMIVAKQGTASVPATITVAPTGNGSAYTAVANFGGGGTAFDGGKVVFKSGTNPGAGGFQTTGLTTGLIYTFKVFTRKGTTWSAGVVITTVPGPPVLLTASLIPSDGSTGVSTDQVFTATFNEKVYISHTTAASTDDDVEFDPASGSSQFIARGAGGPSIVISGKSVDLLPTGGLTELSTVYNILIGNKVLTDSTGDVSGAGGGVNDFSGTTAGNWNFTTSAGATITAPVVGTCVNQFTTLGDIVITENADNNFQGTDNGSFTLVLNFDKTGYIFNPGTTGVTATPLPGGDIQSISVTSVTFTQATFTIQFANVSNDNQAKNDPDAITISGLKVSRDGSMAPPAIIIAAAATTLPIQGLTEGSTVLATINGGTVPTAPIITYPAGNNSYCLNATFTGLSITASDPDGPPETFNWYNDAALSSVNAIGANSRTVAQLIGGSPAAGTYTRYATQVDGCESIAATVTIIITALPTASAGPNLLGINAVCSGASVILGGSPTANGGTGSYTYAWTGPGSPTSVSNPSHVMPDPGASNQTYNYQVVVTDGNGCASTPSVKQITVKNVSETVVITQPSTFTYTTNNQPVALVGSPAGGTFSGVGIIQLNGSYQFDPEIAGVGTWPITYTTTLANGCTKSIPQDFDVTAPYDIFTNLEDKYCNTEGGVALEVSASTVANVLAYINTWNTVYVPNYGYSPLKATFTGIVRNEYEAYYGDNNSIQTFGGTYSSGGQTLGRYYFYPSAIQTDQAYPVGGGIYGTCATCNYAYVGVFMEFANPLFTYPYNIPIGTDQGYYFNNGTVAAIEYGGEFVNVNPVPVVDFSGLISTYCNINTDYTLTGNKPGGSFEISNDPYQLPPTSTFGDIVGDGIKDVTEGIAPGLGEFNPQAAFGGAGAAVGKWIMYSVDPGTFGSDGTTGCIGRQIRYTTIYPSTPITFPGSVPPNNTEFCYEGAPIDIITSQGSPPATGSVTFTGFGMADNSNGVGKFTPRTGFDQKNFGSNSPETITITATYTNSQGCAFPLTRNFIVRPKPTSTVLDPVLPVGNKNFCYNDPSLTLTGNTDANERYDIEYISLGHTQTISSNSFTFDPSLFFDVAVSHGGSNVSDATFNINYIVTDGIGCTAQSTRLFAVSPLAVVTISGLNDGDQICSNVQPFPITFAPINGSLRVNGGLTPLNPVTNSIDFASLPIGNAVSLQYTYNSGVSQCPTVADYTISKISAPAAVFSAAPVCDEDAATFTAAPDADNYTWKWVLGDSVRSGTGNQSINHVFPGLSQGATQTSYLIRLIVENGPTALKVCRDSSEAIQVIGAYPRADFNYADVCQDDFTHFTISANIPIATAEWNFGDGFTLPDNLLNADILGADTHSGRTQGKYGTPEHQFSFTTGIPNRYNVELIARTATTVGGCADIVTRQIAILEKLTLTRAMPYDMAIVDGGTGLWIEEDRSNSSTWEFGAISGKSSMTNVAGNVWVTNATGMYNPTDNSFVNSPCFNLTDFSKPVISLQYWNNTDLGKDGAVLQYSTDGGANWLSAPPDFGGDVVGTSTSGVNWYSNTTISSAPGGHNQFGWSGPTQDQWLIGKNSLDAIPLAKRDNVRFRIAFASDERDEFDGFAFNNVVIEDRNRIMLVEHFSNVDTNDAGIAFSKNEYNTSTILNDVAEVIKIQYHASFPIADPINADNPADHNARAAYYGVTSQTMPLGFIDGGRDKSAPFGFIVNPPNPPWWGDFKQKRSLSSSPYTLTVAKVPTAPDELKITVKGKQIGTVPGSKPILHIVVIEKDVAGNEHVVRKLLPNAGGTPVEQIMDVDSVKLTLAWRPEGLDGTSLSNLAVVAFIQDEITQEIHQSAFDLTSNNLPTVVVTGTEDPEYAKHINLYPNPAGHEVNIELPDAVNKPTPLALLDALGRTVYQAEFKAGQRTKTVSTDNFANGIYMLQIITPNGSKAVRKVMVKH